MSALPNLSGLEHLEQASAPQLLEWAVGEFGGSLAIATAFQAPGMVILDMAARISPQVRVITLDTGRLPESTYQMIEIVRERYGIAVETVAPDAAELEAMVRLHGPNLFYRDVALRNLCCEIRKVRPLERKLRECKAWVTGLRRGQNDSRADVRKVERTRREAEAEPARRLDGGRSERIHSASRRPHASPLCRGLSKHRLRALHKGQSNRARTNAPAAGGGSGTRPKSAAFIFQPKGKPNGNWTCC